MFYFFRLKDHIVQSENGTIYLSDIEKKIHGKFNGHEIGRSMRQVFKGTLSKTVRNKEYWAKLTRLYFGVEWKHTFAEKPEIEKGNVVQDTGAANKQDIITNSENPETSNAIHHTRPNEITLTESDHDDKKTFYKH